MCHIELYNFVILRSNTNDGRSKGRVHIGRTSRMSSYYERNTGLYLVCTLRICGLYSTVYTLLMNSK